MEVCFTLEHESLQKGSEAADAGPAGAARPGPWKHHFIGVGAWQP
jgi:hypothetical protein